MNAIDVFCIGHPNVVGDAVGPMVGSLLKGKVPSNVKIIGTMNSPIIRSNYYCRLEEVRPEAHVIVVDATVGDNVGTITIDTGSTLPGAAILQKIEPIGDISVRCYTGRSIVEIATADLMEVIQMAHKVTTGLIELINNTNNKDLYKV